MTGDRPNGIRLEDWIRISERVDAFEAAYRGGRAPRIEDYLAGEGGPVHEALLRELLAVEWELRRSLSGEGPEPREYTGRFPGLSAWIEAELAEALRETRVPSSRGETAGDEGLPLVRDFELLREIGGGGMGVVYLARKRGRVVDLRYAVKMLAAHGLAPGAVERFLDEMRILERFRHQNVVPIHDCGTSEDGRPYLVMPFCPTSLAEALKDEDPPAPRDAAGLVLQIARAVLYLHDEGVVHRDLKPSNILLDDSGRPWVADFGLARMLADPRGSPASGAIEGTIPYMSPEQAEGRDLDDFAAGCRSDVWSLGVILYELLSGRRPFRGTRAEVLYQILHREPPAPRRLRGGIPRDLEQICLNCLEKTPAQRYRTAAELIEDLERFLQGEPIRHAPPRDVFGRLQRWARREAALASRLAVAAGCSAIMWLYPPIFGEPAPAPEDAGLRALNQGLLALWVVGSWVFQRLSYLPGWSGGARRAWVTIDVLVLAALIELNDGMMSPMTVAFPALIVASGLWLHVPTVVYTTALALLAYAALVVVEIDAFRGGWRLPHKYHHYYLLTLAVVGLIVAYQVHRVRALIRLSEHRPRL